jgi:hypothetical protein
LRLARRVRRGTHPSMESSRTLARRAAPLPAHRATLAAVLLCGAAVAQDQPPATQPGTQPATQPATRGAERLSGWSRWVRGSLQTRYWYRWSDTASDQDLYESLALDFGDGERDAITGHAFGRLAADLDGRDGGDPEFAGLTDTWRHRVHGSLYEAHADLHRLPGLELVRAGRQLAFETPEVAYFDGLRADSVPIGGLALQFGAYGGASTHQYESSADGDWTAGAFAQARPWTGARVRVDWMYLEDETLLGAHQNDLVGVAWWQTIGRVQLEAQYSRLEDRDRDVRARAAWVAEDCSLQLNWYQLLRTQRELVLELDPFNQALLEYFPFWQGSVLASKGFGDHLEARAGADVRRVTDRADVGIFNRDYERWYVTGGVRDLPWTGLAVDLTADLWASDGQHVRTWGAEASQRLGDRWSAALGTYYSLYKYDLLLQRESDHVRTYFGTLRYQPSKAFTFDLRYELEDVDFGEYQILRLGATWRF